jgi:hypothetical protein
LEPPPEKLGVTHWSSRLLGKELGLSNVKVADVWREYGLQPWRRETFKFSTDPELDAKVRDVIALYMNPPDRAVVVCVDELGRAGVHHCSEGEQRVSPTRPPNPACASPRTGLSTD